MSEHSDEFYDVNISKEIISEKEKNTITNMLMKNQNISNKQNDNHWYNNKCFFFSALILSSMVISTGIYMCFIYL
jgi:hypothetical protein